VPAMGSSAKIRHAGWFGMRLFLGIATLLGVFFQWELIEDWLIQRELLAYGKVSATAAEQLIDGLQDARGLPKRGRSAFAMLIIIATASGACLCWFLHGAQFTYRGVKGLYDVGRGLGLLRSSAR
jgi:hypothetical protein